MSLAWKPDWATTKRHFVDWWHHEGLVLGMWGAPRVENRHAAVPFPGHPETPAYLYTAPSYRARCQHWKLANEAFAADCLPVANTGIGPGSLALYLGSEPSFTPRTVWFNPTMAGVETPETLPPLKFDPRNPWWKITEATARECVRLGQGKYMTGFPDLVENFDVLASLRGVEELLVDALVRPGWVAGKIDEINQAYFEVFDRLYDIIKLDDGSSAYWAYYIWGPGKTAKVQCDASIMLSPASFRELVVPALTVQCEWLDYAMFHLDGTACMRHLDALLDIEALDAIEWTPEPTVPNGGNPCWYEFYRKVLAAGKSVQATGVTPDDVIPLLDAVGGKGMYIMTSFATEREAEDLYARVESYR